MAKQTDYLIDRIKTKSKLRLWRFLAIVAFTFVLIMAVASQTGGFSSFSLDKEHVARIKIDNIILTNTHRDTVLEEMSNDSDVKAVIAHIDSPGGTAVGGEILYENLKLLAQKKPLLVVMDNMATSAGYLVALPAERIFARKASITGSIGVILQSPNVKELAEKIGIKVNVIKTGAMKDALSIYKDMTPEEGEIMSEVVFSFYDVFIDSISEHRKMAREDVLKLADGRVFTGLQAVDNGLVDEIGGDKQALDWLVANKKISPFLKIKDVDLKKKEPKWRKILTETIGNNSLIPKEFSLHGLLSIR